MPPLSRTVTGRFVGKLSIPTVALTVRRREPAQQPNSRVRSIHNRIRCAEVEPKPHILRRALLLRHTHDCMLVSLLMKAAEEYGPLDENDLDNLDTPMLVRQRVVGRKPSTTNGLFEQRRIADELTVPLEFSNLTSRHALALLVVGDVYDEVCVHALDELNLCNYGQTTEVRFADMHVEVISVKASETKAVIPGRRIRWCPSKPGFL
mmetsp:Transcript_123586/g.238371  ORF Transcript_123586/g.238371 Transcript_123586/m.238371 type:complete len:207 (+) Transcript_123586:3081-3701(+)